MDNPERVTYFAETDFRNQKTKFGIKGRDRTRHMYIIGKTGMGKSTLLENLAIQDIQNGEGMCFIDPHGSAAESLLEYIPEYRIKDVIYFAPFDLDNPISFNVLETIDEERKHLVAAGLMNAFKKIFVDGSGQSAFSGRMEYILAMTLLALLDTPGETLLGVNRMYADKDYRKKIVNNIKDPSVRSFWVDEYAKYSEKFAQEATASIQNKIGQFTANPLIRNLMGQQKSSFDFRKIMDEKKILLVNLSKGKLGPDNMRLIGGMVVTKIYLAAMSRADVSARELKTLAPFYLYVDEFQNFANESFAEILSESRKYNLALTVANQYIDQMTDDVRGAILGNVGSLITFRIGATDAELLEKEFSPYFTAEDLVNLGFTQIYLKLMIDGIGSQPFSANSLDTPNPYDPDFAREIIEHSRQVYCKPRTQIEEEIQNWFGKVSQSENQTKVVEMTKSHSSPTSLAGSLKEILDQKKINVENKTVATIIQKDTNKNGNQQKNHASIKTGKPNDLLQRIYSGELVETQSEKHKKLRADKQLPLSSIAKDKAPVQSSNKLTLKDAIEKALQDKKKVQEEGRQAQQESNPTEQQPVLEKPQQSQQSSQVLEVPEDVLKKILNS